MSLVRRGTRGACMRHIVFTSFPGTGPGRRDRHLATWMLGPELGRGAGSCPGCREPMSLPTVVGTADPGGCGHAEVQTRAPAERSCHDTRASIPVRPHDRRGQCVPDDRRPHRPRRAVSARVGATMAGVDPARGPHNAAGVARG